MIVRSVQVLQVLPGAFSVAVTDPQERNALALSLASHRPATQETLDLIVRALNGATIDELAGETE